MFVSKAADALTQLGLLWSARGYPRRSLLYLLASVGFLRQASSSPPPPSAPAVPPSTAPARDEAREGENDQGNGSDEGEAVAAGCAGGGGSGDDRVAAAAVAEGSGDEGEADDERAGEEEKKGKLQSMLTHAFYYLAQVNVCGGVLFRRRRDQYDRQNPCRVSTASAAAVGAICPPLAPGVVASALLFVERRQKYSSERLRGTGERKKGRHKKCLRLVLAGRYVPPLRHPSAPFGAACVRAGKNCNHGVRLNVISSRSGFLSTVSCPCLHVEPLLHMCYLLPANHPPGAQSCVPCRFCRRFSRRALEMDPTQAYGVRDVEQSAKYCALTLQARRKKYAFVFVPQRPSAIGMVERRTSRGRLIYYEIDEIISVSKV